MTASAGAAAAAYQGPAAAVRGETPGAQAAIVIVSRDPGAREILHQELSKRYGADYEITVCGRPTELESWMRDLRTAGLPVALVIGGVGAQDPDGIEVLAATRRIDPTALRVAAVRWGDWQSVRSVFDAVALGTVDHWVTRPAQTPDEEFHRSITEFLRDWSSQRGGGFEPVQVIGERWSARSQELRDLFSRHRIPAGFYDATFGPARQMLRELGAAPNVDVCYRVQVTDGSGTGTGHLQSLVLEDTVNGARHSVPADALFVLIGSQPRTEWLGDTVARDRRGFILTGPDLPAGPGHHWPSRRPPLPLETSLPGVFAAGDVRRGSVNRVASAVGEGAATIPLVHRYLHTTAASTT